MHLTKIFVWFHQLKNVGNSYTILSIMMLTYHKNEFKFSTTTVMKECLVLTLNINGSYEKTPWQYPQAIENFVDSNNGMTP
jgi:hypothetical protein